MNKLIQQLNKLDVVVKENELLKNHTTFKIGGPCQYYIKIDEVKKLPEVMEKLKTENLKFFVLGNGSNLLVSNKGFDGAVIKLKPDTIKIDGLEIQVGAGYQLPLLIQEALEAGFTGHEFLVGIPGTVGGAIKGNAGSFGKAMSDVLVSASFINENLELKTLNNNDCKFSYRYSIFKEHDDWLILSAVLKLEKGDISASKELINERLHYRTKTQPQNKYNAGCIFKNIIYSEKLIEKFKSLGWEIPEQFKQNKKIPVAWIIDNLGLKGKAIGGAKISEEHANYIINLGTATADEVVQLISFIKQQVRDKLGVQLEEEIKYVGFED